MKRLMFLCAVAGLMLSSTAVWAEGCGCGGGLLGGMFGCHCIQPPCDKCEDCSDPCCHRLHLPTLCGCEHTHCLIEQLSSSCNCHERISAARKLGNRLHADFCTTPEVLNALVHALMCDTCWEVRKTAAWAIAYQDARVPQGVAALYIASKADRHYLVRIAAAEALDILILCRKSCYKDLFRGADVVIARVKPDYNPTNGNCVNLVMNFCEHCGDATAVCPGCPVLR